MTEARGDGVFALMPPDEKAGGRPRRIVPKRGVAIRPNYNPHDFKMVNEVVAHFCPGQMPRKLKSRFRGPFELRNAIAVYVMAVELGWPKKEVMREVGRHKSVVAAMINAIEDIRDDHAFVEKICVKVRECANGLNL